MSRHRAADDAAPPGVPSPARERRRRRRGNDAGFSIVEIAMTIAIMSIIAVPTMMAVMQTMRAGSLNDDLSGTLTVLQNASDRVNRAPKSCDYTLYAQAAAQSQGWAASTTTVVQQHYVPGATPAVNGTWQALACDVGTATPPALAVQMVTITVVSPDGNVRKTLQVVKSDV